MTETVNQTLIHAISLQCTSTIYRMSHVLDGVARWNCKLPYGINVRTGQWGQHGMFYVRLAFYNIQIPMRLTTADMSAWIRTRDHLLFRGARE